MISVWGALGKGLQVFDSIAEGLAGTAEGQRFSVAQSNGYGAYDYTVVGGEARWDSVRLYGDNAAAVSVIRAAEDLVSAPIANLVLHGWGTRAHEWDGRLVPNLVGGDPTLNLLPDPFNPADEDGGSTPTRSINDSGVTDPDGGSNAMKVTATAQNQQVAFNNISDDSLTGDLVLKAQFKLVSGTDDFRLGGISASKIDFTPTSEWASQTVTVSSYNNTPNLGFSSAPGNADGVIAVYNAQFYDSLAGTVLPSAAVEKAGMDFHAKRPAAYPGSLTIDQYGALDRTSETDGVTLMGHPTPVTLTEFSMGVWVNVTAEPTGTYGNGLSFDFHSGGATVTSGQVGVMGNNGTNYERFGMLYANPGLSTLANKVGQYLVGEGWQHLSVSVSSDEIVTPRINGIPVMELTLGAYTMPTFSKLILGAYNGVSRRRKVLNHLAGYFQGWWFRDSEITQAEAIAQDAHGKARILATGDTRMGERKLAVFGCGDSITAFAPSYFWHLCQDRTLSPRLHAYCEAVGGTNIDDWIADPRKAFLKKQLQAAVDAGYEMALTLHHAGTNEILDWLQEDYHGSGDLTDWIVDYVAYIAELKAIDPKVKCAALTMLPRATLGVGGIYSQDALDGEQIRQTWNQYLRDNYVSMGFDYLIDTGLGTERISASGVITAESISGGTVMGNYRTVAGCVDGNTRSPEATISFSALSGASFTGTTDAGTFTYQDVGRKITGTAGSADIIGVNGDGSVATLSTTGFAPGAYDNEPAGSVTRDTLAHVAFGASSYDSTEWSVTDAVSYYLTDGIHLSQAGGRLLCDEIVSPAIATIQDSI